MHLQGEFDGGSSVWHPGRPAKIDSRREPRTYLKEGLGPYGD